MAGEGQERGDLARGWIEAERWDLAGGSETVAAGCWTAWSWDGLLPWRSFDWRTILATVDSLTPKLVRALPVRGT